MFRHHVFGSLGLLVCLSGCGDPGTSSEDAQDLDRAAAEEELGRVSEALGEPSCGSTPADATLDPTTGQAVSSSGPNYDHPTCRNGFVVDVPGVHAGRALTGGAPPMRWPDPFTCLLNWGYLSLWQKQATGYVKISEGTSLGVWGPFPRVGYVCVARVSLQAPAAGDYKLVSASGVLFGPYGSVYIY
jgi:hypothetical protein